MYKISQEKLVIHNTQKRHKAACVRERVSNQCFQLLMYVIGFFHKIYTPYSKMAASLLFFCFHGN